MPGTTNRRAVRWLRAQLPELVAAGVISSENAAALDRHYGPAESQSNFGFVILATVGAVLVGAGIILLIAHNWDDFSHTARTIIAFIPVLVALAFIGFVLTQRNESRPWRESVAIFDFAAVATAISLISQTYQIQGSFAEFLRVWLLLGLPVIYLLRASVGATVYVIGTIVWLFSREFGVFIRTPNPMFYWFLFLLIVPYFLFRFFESRGSRETAALAVVMTVSLVFGLGFIADFAKSDLGAIAFAGLLTAIYLCGVKFFPRPHGRLHVIALLGGIGIGVTAIVLSFESSWHMTRESFWGLRTLGGNISLAIEFLFPIVAISLAAFDIFRRRFQFSLVAASFPIVTAIIWGVANLCQPSTAEHLSKTSCSFAAAALMNCYALWLGIDILARGIRSSSVARANFGLLLLAVLALSRFFDSELSFVTRGLGFIVVGAGFLVANILMFKKRRTVVAT
ncbi:MAG TPA: DUF2157 domain-containing protein [Chthoniobacterales bacterium]|nr:DUF2157 domain-containing protein [Chthoniobacterales bacterium]